MAGGGPDQHESGQAVDHQTELIAVADLQDLRRSHIPPSERPHWRRLAHEKASANCRTFIIGVISPAHLVRTDRSLQGLTPPTWWRAACCSDGAPAGPRSGRRITEVSS